MVAAQRITKATTVITVFDEIESLENLNLFNEVNNKSTLLVNSENVANNGKSVGWNNVVTIKKNFTKDILDYILHLSK